MEYTKEAIREKLQRIDNIKDKLFYLDEIEAEVKDRIYEIYRTTRMDEVGDFLYAENEWEFVFEHREFNPEFMLTPPLDEKQQAQYLKDYANEIKEATYLNNIDSFIQGQKKFYENQFVKYGMMGGESDERTKKSDEIGIDDFDFDKIRKRLNETNDPTHKVEYILRVKKETKNRICSLEIICDEIRILESSKQAQEYEGLDEVYLLKCKLKNITEIVGKPSSSYNITRLLKDLEFILTQHDYDPDPLIEKKDGNDSFSLGVNWFVFIDEMEIEIKKLKLLIQKIENELSYTIEMEKLANEINRPSKNKEFSKYWMELVSRNFDQNVLRYQLNTLSREDRREYIDYCVEQYGNYTIEEWLNEFEIIDKNEQYAELDKKELDPEQELKVRTRIDKTNYRDSTVGKWTRENLELFRIKYIDKKQKNGEVRTEINESNLERKKGDVELQQSEQMDDKKQADNIEEQKKVVPSKGLKKLGKEYCEKLISERVITEILDEKKADKAITTILIPVIEKEYILTKENKKSLHDYFRQGKLMIKKDKKLGLIVLDTYIRKK